MLRFLGRIILVPLGFLIGAAVALCVLLSLGLERITHVLSGRPLETEGIDVFVSIVHGFLGLAGAATIIPAVLVVVVGEVARIRSILYYVLGGGLALAALPLMAAGGRFGSDGLTGLTSNWPVFATAGFAGGLAYWLLAGRRA